MDPNITRSSQILNEDVTKDLTTISENLQNTTSLISLNTTNSTQSDWITQATADFELPLTVLWTYIAVRLLWGGMGVFGNSLTIAAVIKYERLQTCTNYLICSLAVSDLVASVTVPLIIVYEIYPHSSFFIPICLFHQTVCLISSSGNMLNILYLSIDRYIYIAFPLRYHELVTVPRIVVALTLSWIACLLSPPLLIYTRNTLEIGMPCKFHMFLNDLFSKYYLLIWCILFLNLTIGFNIAIARIAHNQARQIQGHHQSHNTLANAISQSTKKISRTLGLVLGVYLFCIMPQLIVSAITVDHHHVSYYNMYTTIHYWANAWVNPLIFAWRLKDFKIAFRKIFTGTGHFNEVPGLVV